MSIVYQDAVLEQVPATDTTIYTAPSNCSSAHIQFANVTCEDATGDSITINIVQSGGAVAVTNEYIQSKAITAGATDGLSNIINCVLKPGDFVSAKAATIDRLNLKIGIKEIYA